MATDQEIREAGYYAIPQQQYLLNPFELPQDQEPVTNAGIVNTNAFANSGGDNFNVYNADPNRITNMNANKYALQDARRANELSYVGNPNLNLGYTSDTAAMKNMEWYPEYYGLDKPAPSKAAQLIEKGINFIPGMGLVRTASKFLGNAMGGVIPMNRRAIMENQLGAQGVMVDDIGRIVVGPGGQYNTEEGIMAGYNVNKMDEDTFDKRTKRISKTLMDPDKYGLTKEQIDGLISGKYTEEDFEDEQYNMKGTKKQTNLISNLINIQKAKRNWQDATGATDKIIDIRTDTQDNISGDGATFIGGGANLQDAGGTAPGGMYATDYQGGPTGVDAGTANVQDYADIYAKGGRVGLRYGGLLSIL